MKFRSVPSTDWLARVRNGSADIGSSGDFDSTVVASIATGCWVLLGCGEWAGEEQRDEADDIEGELELELIDVGLLYESTDVSRAVAATADLSAAPLSTTSSFLRFFVVPADDDTDDVCWHLFGMISNIFGLDVVAAGALRFGDECVVAVTEFAFVFWWCWPWLLEFKSR